MKKNNFQHSTFLTREQALAERKWLLFDANGKTLGRFASEVAKVLCGKHKPSYTPHVDCGDGVIIINATKIVVTGNKEGQKTYRYYTGSMGGLREVPYSTMMARKPEEILRKAIEGMMPNNRLGKQQVKKLRIFAGHKHDLQAQQPIKLMI
jgi:large subunit ribosomal protein L13